MYWDIAGSPVDAAPVYTVDLPEETTDGDEAHQSDVGRVGGDAAN